jgi:DNA ligase (NAD+)
MKQIILELIEFLNYNSNIYYNNLSQDCISDTLWDKTFDELKQLEDKTGIIMSNSPTQNAGYPVVDGLNKIKHSTPLLSLGKTKNVNDLVKFLGYREGVLMFKLDGGTQIVDYEHGDFDYLATRGSSSTNEGQDITHNASAIIGIPKSIGTNHIQVVGEGIMYRSKLEEINSKLNPEDQYANARNLANASASMLDSKRVAARDIRFIAFATLECDDFSTKVNELKQLESEGFRVVEHVLVTKDNLIEEVERMTKLRSELDYDIDGLVLAHNDMEYGRSLGKTSHHFKNAMAFKFEDDEEETTLRNILVDIGKSGQVSYVAEFDSVELCGTTVGKASLSNYSLIEGLKLGIGDTITVRKANEIIPQVTGNLTMSNTYEKALNCPVCGSELEHNGIHQFCTNFGCDNQVIGRLVHFCSREAMDISGLSEETIRTIYNNFNPKVLYGLETIYDLPSNKESLMTLDRFGKRKVDKFCDAIESSKTMDLNRVLYALSIPSVGRTASKKIAEHYGSMRNILDGVMKYKVAQLVGESVAEKFMEYFEKNNFINMIEHLLSLGLTMVQPKELVSSDSTISGLNFCVTGKVFTFKNRDELKAKISELGGKNQSGVSKNTDYLINNDIESVTGKNKKAKDLDVKIITEDQFIEMIGGL